MPVSRSHKLAIVQRRQQVADLYLQAWTQMAIADHLGCAQTTVSADLIQIRRDWRESAVRDFDEAREVELQKIDRVEREAWAAWARSQQPAQSAQINDETPQRKTRRHVRNQYGDPRFLEQVNKCIGMRCTLLGLGTIRGEDGSDGFTFDERRDRIFALAVALRDRQGVAPAGEGLGGGEPRLVRADRESRTVDAGPAPQLPGPGDP